MGPRVAILTLLLLAGLGTASGARRFVLSFNGADGSLRDVDGACNGTCTFRLIDTCTGCLFAENCDSFRTFGDLCRPDLPPPVLLYAVPGPEGRRRIGMRRVSVNHQEILLKCHAPKEACTRPPVADDLVGNWRVDPPATTESDCRAGLPVYFERSFSISRSADRFEGHGSVWSYYQPFEPPGGTFALSPYGTFDYDTRYGLVPLCSALNASNGFTRIDIRIDANRPDAAGRLPLVQRVTYSTLDQACPPCTMTSTGTASRLP